MESNATFFYTKTINVFTDASCLEMRPAKIDKVPSTSPGFIATYKGRIIASGMEIYLGENSMYGEAKAVELAVNWCIYAASKGLYVEEGYSIFSDNLPVVQYIYNTLKGWFDQVENKLGLAILPRGKMTTINWEANAYNAAFSIFASGLAIRLFYTKSHVKLNPFSLSEPQKKFVNLNRSIHGDLSNEINKAIMHDQATFNNMVDIMTRNFLSLNQEQIENDIDAAEGLIDFSNNKPLPIRWPFIIPAIDQKPMQQKIYAPLMLLSQI